MDALPFYKWHWQDWRANRRVQRMPWQAKGPYRELLDEFWAEGSLPTDMAELADIVGCTVPELTDLWVYIGPCWEERDGRLYNAKMDEQRTATDKARVAMANGGFKGGKASNSVTRANPKPTLTVPQGKPDIEEETRGEKTKGKKTSSRNKSESNPAHAVFKGLIFTSWKEWGNEEDPPWDGAEGKQLGMLMGANPKLSPDGFYRLLKFRGQSKVNLAERPSAWIRRITDYAKGPLNEFGKPEPSLSPAPTRRYMEAD